MSLSIPSLDNVNNLIEKARAVSLVDRDNKALKEVYNHLTSATQELTKYIYKMRVAKKESEKKIT